MGQYVFTVHARRWGDTETHSYIVGVYPTKGAALKAAKIEEAYRGGKYECEILGFEVGRGIEGRHESWPEIIKAVGKTSHDATSK